MINAVLFKSAQRFDAFHAQLVEAGCDVVVLDFDEQDWIEFDYSQIDLLIYYPNFIFSSNHPQALSRVYDNLGFIHSRNPKMAMYPDPGLSEHYSDKYRQCLYLKSGGYPIPETYPILSRSSLDEVEAKLGYPMVVKNRYGAGGDYVAKVSNRKELEKYYRLSTLDLFNLSSIGHLFLKFFNREFLYFLIRRKKMSYPFFSAPLLAQKFISHDRDLKVVVGSGRVVEAHWRYQASPGSWKMNIDGGGTGIWAKVPDQALALCERLARDLNARWINCDLIESDGEFLVSEFSPVWHHYAYQEKPDFEYHEDYNIDVPLQDALNLEKMIVDSLVKQDKTG